MNYYIYVTAESQDEVHVVKFDGEKAVVIKDIPVGVWPVSYTHLTLPTKA